MYISGFFFIIFKRHFFCKIRKSNFSYAGINARPHSLKVEISKHTTKFQWIYKRSGVDFRLDRYYEQELILNWLLNSDYESVTDYEMSQNVKLHKLFQNVCVFYGGAVNIFVGWGVYFLREQFRTVYFRFSSFFCFSSTIICFFLFLFRLFFVQRK